jgi:ferredoxin
MNDLNALRNRLDRCQAELSDLRRCPEERSAATRRKQSRYAVVDLARCTGCRLCEGVCPTGAITVTHVVHVSTSRCSGCALCIGVCPRGALRLGGG